MKTSQDSPTDDSPETQHDRTLHWCLEVVAEVERGLTADGWVKAKIQAALNKVREGIRELK